MTQEGGPMCPANGGRQTAGTVASVLLYLVQVSFYLIEYTTRAFNKKPRTIYISSVLS